MLTLKTLEGEGDDTLEPMTASDVSFDEVKTTVTRGRGSGRPRDQSLD